MEAAARPLRAVERRRRCAKPTARPRPWSVPTATWPTPRPCGMEWTLSPRRVRCWTARSGPCPECPSRIQRRRGKVQVVPLPHIIVAFALAKRHNRRRPSRSTQDHEPSCRGGGGLPCRVRRTRQGRTAGSGPAIRSDSEAGDRRARRGDRDACGRIADGCARACRGVSRERTARSWCARPRVCARAGNRRDIAPGGDGGPASSVPEFWGLREFDAFLLVVDGVPWGGAFNPDLSTISVKDVARIEVMRGPGAGHVRRHVVCGRHPRRPQVCGRVGERSRARRVVWQRRGRRDAAGADRELRLPIERRVRSSGVPRRPDVVRARARAVANPRAPEQRQVVVRRGRDLARPGSGESDIRESGRR